MEFTEFFITALSLLSLVGAGIGVMFVLIRLLRRIVAEHHYTRLLRARHDQLELLIDEVSADGKIDYDEWKRLERTLVDIVNNDGLAIDDRELILDPLRQTSNLGRRRFTKRLLQRAGLEMRLAI